MSVAQTIIPIFLLILLTAVRADVAAMVVVDGLVIQQTIKWLSMHQHGVAI